jgi:hypothetical protein
MPEQVELHKRVEDILRPLSGVDDQTKAQAWSETIDATSGDDLTNRLQNIKLPDEAKGQLWYLRFGDEAAHTDKFSEFFGEAKRLNPLPAAQTIVHGAQLLNPSLPPETRQQYKKELYEGFVQPQAEQFHKAGEQFQKGNIGGAITYGAAGLLPGLGPTIAESGERIRSGDVAGGAGELAFGVVPSLLGKLPKTAKTAAFRAVGKAAGPGLPMRLYKAGLQPPATMKLKTQEAVLKEGLRTETLPKSKKGLRQASKRVKEGVKDIDVMTDPQSVTGQHPLRRGNILGPINKEITRRLKSNDPSSADGLIKLRDQWKIYHPGKYMTVAEAQELARNTDRVTNPSVYNVNAHPGEDPLASKLLRTGEAKEIAKAFPGLGDTKRNVHLNIKLRDTIDANLRKSSAVLDKYGTWILTGHAMALGGAALTGNLKGALAVTGSALASMIAREAVQNPNTLARLAFALNREGITLPFSKKGAAYSAVTLGPNMEPPEQRGNEPPEETPAPPPAAAEFSPDANPFRSK